MALSAFEIFHAVIALPPDERAQEIQRHCGDDAALAALVQKLVAADADDTGNTSLVFDELVEDELTALPLAEPRSAVLTAGAVVGMYRAEHLLGRGGLAEVWAVCHVDMGTRHALKLLHQTAPAVRARLREEGRLQARLDHPNIVRVTEVIEHPDGTALVMELVEGPSLRALLAGESLPLPRAIAVGAAILEGIAHAHDQGLIHRDLKPENILMAEAAGEVPVPRITDFGLAKALGGLAPKRTRTGEAMGTPGYMAPEQYRDASRVDARADVFALGCILYELVTGAAPFPRGDLVEQYQRADAMDFIPPTRRAPLLPRAIGALITRALAARPEDRPTDARQLQLLWRAAGEGLAPPRPEPAPTLNTSERPPAEPGAPLLPIPSGPLLGRAAELAALVGQLAIGASLLAVVGPAGVGKTRLVLALARAQMAAFEGGVLYRDLSVRRGTPGPPFPDLASRGRTLFILDHFDGISPAAHHLARWRTGAPRSVFVVAGRVATGLAGERLFSLGPLSPPEAGQTDLSTLSANPAVALYTTCARAREPGFTLEASNAADIAELVRLLDGLPLAIELAAPHAGAAGATALAGAEGLSLEDVLEWSWSRLDRWEQDAFVRLSALEESFTLEAAESVLEPSDAASETLERPWPVDLVASLVEKHLVRPLDDCLGEPRFLVLPSLRQYATTKLAQTTWGALPEPP